MMKCPHCGHENKDGLLLVDIDQDRQGNYIQGGACENCHELIEEYDPDQCYHDNVAPGGFCETCGHKVVWR